MELSVIDGGMKITDDAKKLYRELDIIGRKLTKILLKTTRYCDILKNTSEIIVQNVESEVPMDDSKLRALLTAVQCGSFGKAAAQLGYTQSAMTHLVSKLEAELGCTLLLRSSKGVRLSEEGEHLLPYINQVISACDALRSEAEAYCAETRDADLEARFGTPQQVAAAYVDAMSTQELLAALRRRRQVLTILIAAVLAALLLWVAALCVSLYDYHQAYNGKIVGCIVNSHKSG